MTEKLQELRKSTTETLNLYLIERYKTFEARKDLSEWVKQQHAEMQAEHAWLNAKQAYEIELYNLYGVWETLPPKK